MDIKQLQYFLAIAEEGQITKAAKKLHVAQPALSQQLRLLEDELGIQLLERGSRKIRLTEEGIALRNRARQLVELMDTTTQELREINQGLKGTISIGTVPSVGTKFLPERIQLFHGQYPEINFQIWEGETFELLDMLNQGIVDIGIVRACFDLEPYKSISLPSDPMIAAMHKDWNIGTQLNHINMLELAEKPLLLHSGATPRIIEYCRQYGFEPRILCKSTDVRSVIALADKGIGIAIIPKSSMAFVPSHNLHYKTIADRSLELATVVVWLRDHRLPAAVKNFLETFIS